jgi:uncharacterized protein YggE
MAAVAVSFLACAASVSAQTPDPSTGAPTVVTSGEAIVTKAPDRAYISISAEARARESKEAQRLNAQTMTEVLAKLKSAGLAGDAIKTTGYDLQPDFEYANGRQTLKGYISRNSIEARVDDLDKLGGILDVAVGAGATSVSNVRFDLKDRRAAEQEALRLAVQDARARADAIAAGAGMKVERIVRIEEQRAGGVTPRPMMMDMRMAGAPATPTPVVPGNLEIHANVTVTSALR